MIAPVKRNGGPSVTWANMIATLAFATVLAGAGWTLFQTQFAGLVTQITENKELVNRASVLLQTQIDRRISEVEKTFDEFKKSAEKRDLTKDEFKQYETNISGQLSNLRNQIQLLEQTRPTTGELQAANKNALETATRLEERVRSLETRLFNPAGGTKGPVQ